MVSVKRICHFLLIYFFGRIHKKISFLFLRYTKYCGSFLSFQQMRWILKKKCFLFGHTLWHVKLGPKVKLEPPAVGAQSLNHWTTRKVQDEFLDPECLYASRNGIKNTSIISALFFSTSSWVIITHSLLIRILSNLLSLVTCQLKYSFALIWMNFLLFFPL